MTEADAHEEQSASVYMRSLATGREIIRGKLQEHGISVRYISAAINLMRLGINAITQI